MWKWPGCVASQFHRYGRSDCCSERWQYDRVTTVWHHEAFCAISASIQMIRILHNAGTRDYSFATITFRKTCYTSHTTNWSVNQNDYMFGRNLTRPRVWNLMLARTIEQVCNYNNLHYKIMSIGNSNTLTLKTTLGLNSLANIAQFNALGWVKFLFTFVNTK